MADEQRGQEPKAPQPQEPQTQGAPAQDRVDPPAGALQGWREVAEAARREAAAAFVRARAGAAPYVARLTAEWRALIGVASPTGATFVERFIARARRAGAKAAALYAHWRARRAERSANRPSPVDQSRFPFWRRALVAAGWITGLAAAAFVGFFVYVTWGMPSTRDLWTANDAPSLTFLDRSGRVILREGAQNAPPVAIENLPDHVANAVLSIEDKRFYDHMGVDFEGLGRALVQNVQAGRVVQGGSTLTQQLAKNLFLTNDRTFRRKAQEIVLALWLESQFTKRELIALYLSRVYFGAGAWGVEQASERYFDKPAAEMTLEESALLAALLKAPSRLNPALDTERAKERRNLVLAEMAQDGFITEAERAAAAETDVVVRRLNPAGDFGYFRTWIEPLLNEVIGDQRDDFIVETTLDIAAQRAGEQVVEQRLAESGEALNASQAALLSLDASGGVLAMVGGRGFSDSQFNRTTQMRRQPGSSFKFFIYLAAMENDFAPNSIMVDRPITIGDWSPMNYDRSYYGAVTLERAYALSLNMVAIQLAQEVGGRTVIDVARRLGVRSKLEDFRSLALGAQELTLSEMTAAYGAMANGGFRMEPYGVQRVRRASGEIVYERRLPPVRVIEDAPLRLMNQIGMRVVTSGTATRARIEGRDVAGKTGTGNDYRDTWFIGYTPGVVTGVWVGNDDFSPMRRVTGGSLPASIWRDFMETAIRDLPAEPLRLPRPEDYPKVVREKSFFVEAPALEPIVPVPAGPPLGELEEMPMPSG